MTPTLIACSHGTSDPAGRAAIASLVADVAALLPDVRVVPAFVDVEEPRVADVVDRWASDGPVVVVPMLLSTGFHTKVDIARAVEAHPGVAVAAPALGPHEVLIDVLESRLAEVGFGAPGDAVVLAAAGSTDPAAALDVEAVASQLSGRLGVPVRIGFAAGAGPRIPDVVAEARAAGARRVVAASYVVAPGFFARVIEAAGADVVTAPLAPDGRLAGVVTARYIEVGSDTPLSGASR